ncbi:MAG: 4,5-DOPA dioxygenase extradiol [Cyanobacteriota bacterium]
MKNMPVLFVGHGSPMNAIEKNKFTDEWERIANKIEKPKAILVISAHWYTEKTRVLSDQKPLMTYDMYGFPRALYEVKYSSDGSPHFAKETQKIIKSTKVIEDNSWGYDHGTWSVLNIMYPKADIPVYQLSMDINLSPEEHYKIGQEISSLRNEGVLILGSGNVVHNLRTANFASYSTGYPESEAFDKNIKELILKKDYKNVINYDKNPFKTQLAFETPEHYLPLLYILGATNENDSLEVFNESYVYGSLSMTSYFFS